MNIATLAKNRKEMIKSILVIAFPTIADMLVQTLLGFFDMVMVGRLGPAAIGAVGMGNAPVMTVTTVFFAISVGTTALMSRAYGARQKHEGKEVMGQSMLLSIPISFVVTALFLSFANPILRFLGGGGDIREALKYFYVVSAGLPFVCFNVVFAAAYRSISKAKIPMRSNVISVIANIILNYLFIFVLDMGVLGAGIATSLARGMVFFYYIYLTFFTSKYWLGIRLRHLKYKRETVRRILNIGVPSAVEQSLFRVGMLFFEIMVINLGTLAYAAHKIALTAESFSFNLGFGFSVAGTALVGQAMGKDNIEEAETTTYLTTGLSVAVMTMFGIIFFIVPDLIIKMFTDDPDIRPLAEGALRIVSTCQPFLAASMVLSGVLRGIGDTRTVFWISNVGMYIVRLPLTYYMLNYLGIGLMGVWCVMTVDLAVRSYLFYRRFRAGKWKYIKV